MNPIKLHNLEIRKDGPLVVICGPCVIESKDHTLACADFLKTLFSSIDGVELVFKASFDKANRSSITSYRGPGIDDGLKILQEVKATFNIPVTSDVHTPEQVEKAKEVLDIIQIPAFLCRQTDLIIAAAKSKKPVNVKKGQFLAPWDMKNVLDKIVQSGNNQIILTDRGTTFGYNNLVSDFRSIPIMQEFGHFVCYDASHSVQLPGGQGQKSGGQREFIPTLAKAAIASGVDCIFLEAHPDPANAKSDADSVFPFGELKKLLCDLAILYKTVRSL